MPLGPLAPCVGLLALFYVLYANWLDPAVGRPSLVATLVMLAVAALYFFLLRRHRGAGLGMTGPVEEPGPS